MSPTTDDGLPPEEPAGSDWASDTVLPATRPGRRAADRRPVPRVRLVVVLVIAVVSAVALILAWARVGTEASPVAAEPSAKPTVPVLSESASTSPTPTASPTPSATPSSATPSPSASRTSASPSAASSTTRPPATVDRSVAVTVLNGTSRSGLAAKAAAELRAKGWNVVSIGNWRGGGVDGTTVFVTGHRDAAATMRRDLPVADLTTAPIGAMNRNRITVVVMDDYARS